MSLNVQLSLFIGVQGRIDSEGVQLSFFTGDEDRIDSVTEGVFLSSFTGVEDIIDCVAGGVLLVVVDVVRNCFFVLVLNIHQCMCNMNHL